MSKFKLEFDCDNAAFSTESGEFDVYEVAGIIGDVGRKVAKGQTEGQAIDSNGNKVGQWVLQVGDEQ